MKNYRFFAGILASAITLVIFLTLIFLFQDSLWSRADERSFLYQAIFIYTWYLTWKTIYKSFCKSFSKNIPRKQADLELFLNSNERFILFLRPFNTDTQLEEYLVDVYDPFVGIGASFRTIEEQIVEAFKIIGCRTVGIANNRSDNLVLGYERYAADDVKWKGHVSQLIIKSRYICILGFGKGEFQWEINEILNQKCLHKVLIFLPRGLYRSAEYIESFKAYNISHLLTEKGRYESLPIDGIIYYDKKAKEFYRSNFSEFGFLLKKKNPIQMNLMEFIRTKLSDTPPVIIRRNRKIF